LVADAMLAALRTVLSPNEAIYVSTPITTGEPYLHALEHGSRHLSQELIREIVALNMTLAAAAVNETRSSFSPTPVIDPTALEDQPDWEQDHYHAFWLRVIGEFVFAVVLRDGWQYSNGCALEFIRSRSKGIKVLKQNFDPLTDEEAARLLVDSDLRFTTLGVSMRAIAFAREMISSEHDRQSLDVHLDKYLSR
jgi:hypothetical protein